MQRREAGSTILLPCTGTFYALHKGHGLGGRGRGQTQKLNLESMVKSQPQSLSEL